jgi:D-xylonolactonase
VNNTLEIIAQDNNRCGEGPIWDATLGRLLWTDAEDTLIYQYYPASGEKSILCRDVMAVGIVLNQTGELLFSGPEGLTLWRAPGDYRKLITEYEGEALSFNDLIADPAGRVYVGSYYWGENGMEKHGKLYLVDTNGDLHVVDEGIELANGLGFSPDDRTLYFTDSAARRIYAYDVHPQTGELSHKRLFVQVPREEGLPDGMTVDSQGFVWSAQWYGSQIVRYDPDGKVERRIEMPVRQVSSVAFGGPDLMDLYITSAGASWPSPLAPPGYDFQAPNMGGSLYRLRLDIPGRLEHRANLSYV